MKLPFAKGNFTWHKAISLLFKFPYEIAFDKVITRCDGPYSYYRIVLNTMSHYIHIMRTETRIIQEVLKYLCSDNANFMAIFSHYIPGRVVI